MKSLGGVGVEMDDSAMDLLVIGTNGYVSGILPSSGQILWTTRLGSGIFSAPASSDVSVLLRHGLVFAGSMGHLFCLNAANGEILWHNELPGMGHDDISLSMEGVSVQFLEKVEQRN